MATALRLCDGPPGWPEIWTPVRPHDALAPLCYDGHTARHRFRVRAAVRGPPGWHVYASVVSKEAWRLVARAATAAAHPVTVYLHEWRWRSLDAAATRGRARGDAFCPIAMGFVHEWQRPDGVGATAERPIELRWLGRDFFERVYRTATRHIGRVVWFRVSETGEVYHSGAKRGEGARCALAGKRYCHRCAQCFSANNFVTQHLRTHRTSVDRDDRAVGQSDDDDDAEQQDAASVPPSVRPLAGHFFDDLIANARRMPTPAVPLPR